MSVPKRNLDRCRAQKLEEQNMHMKGHVLTRFGNSFRSLVRKHKTTIAQKQVNPLTSTRKTNSVETKNKSPLPTDVGTSLPLGARISDPPPHPCHIPVPHFDELPHQEEPPMLKYTPPSSAGGYDAKHKFDFPKNDGQVQQALDGIKQEINGNILCLENVFELNFDLSLLSADRAIENCLSDLAKEAAVVLEDIELAQSCYDERKQFIQLFKDISSCQLATLRGDIFKQIDGRDGQEMVLVELNHAWRSFWKEIIKLNGGSVSLAQQNIFQMRHTEDDKYCIVELWLITALMLVTTDTHTVIEDIQTTLHSISFFSILL